MPLLGHNRRRSINFKDLYDHIDAVNADTRKRRREAFDRIDRAIEAAISDVEEIAEDIGVTPPPAVVATGGFISEGIAKALAADRPWKQVPTFETENLRKQLETFERQLQAAYLALEAYERAADEDDEDVFMLMMEL